MGNCGLIIWRKVFFFLLAGFIIVALGSCSLFSSNVTPPKVKTVVAPPPPPPPSDLPYTSVDLDYPLSLVTKPKIIVKKEERRLWLIQDATLIRDYHIGLGPSPRGDKYYRGDGRTPEGEYFVCSKNSASNYYKALGINYPSPRHAEAALASGIISQNDYSGIKQANDAGKLPPANTALGGLIMIHGGGSHEDWTLGCVAVHNRAIDEIFSAVPVGTPVEILP